MTAKSHPILLELSEQMPENSKTFLNIQNAEDYADIAEQARLEMNCLKNIDGTLEDERNCRAVLTDSGYGDWLKDLDEDNDRLRVIGALELISDLARELAED
ncbi:MAG: hypothetical protein G3M78_05315 [Candidatus Nitrohelix vancouverensis]|uniref:Uncharacterized protein n=1 Tax=Candidatus Nitrohelix vancouverensis TaxID=2705534 RepID=A0A7T0G2Y4_9BACT|nr:MAG: hypothetical protein G3M78_05315 [Candidatus Nitrohelix vancouverensis]